MLAVNLAPVLKTGPPYFYSMVTACVTLATLLEGALLRWRNVTRLLRMQMFSLLKNDGESTTRCAKNVRGVRSRTESHPYHHCVITTHWKALSGFTTGKPNPPALQEESDKLIHPFIHSSFS